MPKHYDESRDSLKRKKKKKPQYSDFYGKVPAGGQHEDYRKMTPEQKKRFDAAMPKKKKKQKKSAPAGSHQKGA